MKVRPRMFMELYMTKITRCRRLIETGFGRPPKRSLLALEVGCVWSVSIIIAFRLKIPNFSVKTVYTIFLWTGMRGFQVFNNWKVIYVRLFRFHVRLFVINVNGLDRYNILRMIYKHDSWNNTYVFLIERATDKLSSLGISTKMTSISLGIKKKKNRAIKS